MFLILLRCQEGYQEKVSGEVRLQNTTSTAKVFWWHNVLKLSHWELCFVICFITDFFNIFANKRQFLTKYLSSYEIFFFYKLAYYFKRYVGKYNYNSQPLLMWFLYIIFHVICCWHTHYEISKQHSFLEKPDKKHLNQSCGCPVINLVIPYNKNRWFLRTTKWFQRVKRLRK